MTEEARGPSLTVDGLTVPVFRRRSRRARRVQVRVETRGAILVLPWRANEAQGNAFLQRHARWAARRFRELRDAQARVPVPVAGNRLPFRDGALWLALKTAAADMPDAVSRDDDALTVYCRNPDDQAAVVGLLTTWYRQQAAALALGLTEHLARNLKARPQTVRIRDLRSRWGSCSARGAISLNWRLILAPDDVFEYVVVHELCHLRHARHNHAFWTSVQKLTPRAAAARQWLREHQAWMMSFLRDDAIFRARDWASGSQSPESSPPAIGIAPSAADAPGSATTLDPQGPPSPALSAPAHPPHL